MCFRMVYVRIIDLHVITACGVDRLECLPAKLVCSCMLFVIASRAEGPLLLV